VSPVWPRDSPCASYIYLYLYLYLCFAGVSRLAKGRALLHARARAAQRPGQHAALLAPRAGAIRATENRHLVLTGKQQIIYMYICVYTYIYIYTCSCIYINTYAIRTTEKRHLLLTGGADMCIYR